MGFFGYWVVGMVLNGDCRWPEAQSSGKSGDDPEGAEDSLVFPKVSGFQVLIAVVVYLHVPAP
jgi:hypothetical protein